VSLYVWLRRFWLQFTDLFKASHVRVDPCPCTPLELPDCEHVARALYYTFHVDKNGKLKWQAFQPDRGESDISVMRTGCLTATECKQKAKSTNRQGEYKGFGLLLAEEIRKGQDVQDSRVIFCGHADILLGVRRPDTEDGDPPEDPTATAKLRDVARRLLTITVVRLDSSADLRDWPATDSWLPLPPHGGQ